MISQEIQTDLAQFATGTRPVIGRTCGPLMEK